MMHRTQSKKHATDDLDKLFNLSGSMACIIDFNGYFTRVSPAFSETLGYTSEELLSRPVLDFILPADREKTLDIRENKLKKGLKLLDFENRYVCKDGSLRWLSWTSRSIPAEGIILAIAYDITRRKEDDKAFNALMGATSGTMGHEFFRRLVGELSKWLGVDYCTVLELSGGRARVISMICDGEYVKDFEYDLAGTPCEKVQEGGYCFYEKGVRKLFTEDKALQNMNAEAYIGYALKGRDGKTIGILNGISRTLLNVPSRTKEVFSIMAARASVELERIQTQKALKESEEKMRVICEAANDAIVMIDENGKVVYWNPAATSIFGYTEEDVFGTAITDIIVTDKARKAFIKRLALFREFGEAKLLPKILEIKARRKDGTIFPIEHSISAVNLRGKLCIISIIKDISQRKKAEKQLKDKIKTIKVMHEIDKAILSTLDPMEIRRCVVKMIKQLIPCDRSTVRLVNWERGGFVFAAGLGGDSSVDAEFVPFNESSAMDVVRSLRPQYISDLREEKKLLPFEQRLLKAGYLSHIRVPLIVKSKISGILHLASTSPAAFAPEDLIILNQLSLQIVMALENSRIVIDLEKLLIATIKTLSDIIDAKSHWTRGHSERVTDIALRIGKKMGLGEDKLKKNEIGTLLHDIGKIGTNEDILNKAGPLTDKEIRELRKHSIKGAEILSNISQFEDIISDVRHHHEFYDGTGYPDGLKGKDIPLGARILSVADAVDAMASNRPYRKRRSLDMIVDELEKCSGQQFDPEVVEAYLDICSETVEPRKASPSDLSLITNITKRKPSNILRTSTLPMQRRHTDSSAI
jgi:PAS domain S-box-containing protein/putative nucleotidyltransferase with HDIG domain